MYVHTNARMNVIFVLFDSQLRSVPMLGGALEGLEKNESAAWSEHAR